MMNMLLPRARRLLAGWVLGMLCASLQANAADPAQDLRDAYQGLARQLADNPFHRPWCWIRPKRRPCSKATSTA